MKPNTILRLLSVLMLAAIANAQAATPQSSNAQVTVPCTGPSGARFNLEPRNNAVPQNQPNADFLLNRVGPGEDLLVQGANDWRGNLKTPRWDGAVSGYYVHRSNTADCSVQFEGGLPNITVNGVGVYNGIGNTVVAADPARDAFFLADARIGPTGLQDGIGLFRATAADLLSTKACPDGTHTAAEAATCWAATPPALVLPTAALGDVPALAVDERSTGSGKGAGDVYVSAVGAGSNSTAVLVAACTNMLQCGTPVSLPNSSTDLGFVSAQVRSNGVLTIAYGNANTDGSMDAFFVTCTPAGAPRPPVCGTPLLAQHIAVPIDSSLGVLFPVQNFSLLTFTFPKLTNRAESGGKFTTFLVYDDCKNPFSFQNPPIITCVDAEVLLTATTNNGATWSKPVSVDTATGHHFFPSIATDSSTGIVHIAYYSAEGDPFNHSLRVFRNQIAAGTTTPGSPIAVTTVMDPIDETPGRVGSVQTDFFLGIVARGTSTSGQSHLYTSFDSTVVSGSYHGQSLAELNNHVSLATY